MIRERGGLRHALFGRRSRFDDDGELAMSCWLTPRSKAGVMTVIWVGVTLVTKPSFAA